MQIQENAVPERKLERTTQISEKLVALEQRKAVIQNLFFFEIMWLRYEPFKEFNSERFFLSWKRK